MAAEALAELEETQPLLAPERSLLRDLLLEAFKFQAAPPARRIALLTPRPDATPPAAPDAPAAPAAPAALAASAALRTATRFRPRAPNMVRLQGEGK